MDHAGIDALNLLCSWAKDMLRNEAEVMVSCDDIDKVHVRTLKHFAVEILKIKATMDSNMVTLINTVGLIQLIGDDLISKVGMKFAELVPPPKIIIQYHDASLPIVDNKPN